MGRVLHGSYSGYFPFCINEAEPSDVGEGTEFPLKLSLEKAIELYWRIKKWNFYINQDGVIAEFNFDRVGEFEPTQNPQKEEDLVCNIPIGGDFFPSPFDQIQPAIYFNQLYFLINPSTQEKEYYPSISFTGNYAERAWTSIFTPPAEFVGTVEIETFGQFNCALSSPYSQTIKLRPIKWWSYGGIYNENTGERI